jgi:hypothetical protein
MQRVITELVDDIDGTTAEETVNFAIDGIEYEIDLSKQNASNLRKGLDEYVAKGRRTGGRAKRAPAKGRPGADKGDTGAIRDWAQAHGLKVSSRGRISAEVAQAYKDAHKS